MALTNAQRDFINNYVANLGRLRAGRARSQYADFARRYNKTEEALNVLPDGHPTRSLLIPLLQAAKSKAEGGEFKAAYRDLETVKNQAKLAANGYVDSINAGALKADIDNLETVLNDHKDEIDQAIGRLEAFKTSINRYPTAADKGSLRDATLFLKGFARYEAVIAADFNGRVDLFKTRCDAAGADDMPGRIARLRHKIAAVEKAGRMGEISEQVARVVVLERVLDSENGLYKNSAEVGRRIKAYKDDFAARLKQIKSLDSYKSEEDWKSIKLDEMLAMYDRDEKIVTLMFKDTEGYDLPDTATLQHAMEVDDMGLKQAVAVRLQREEEARIERAREEMRAAAERDRALVDGTAGGRTYDPEVAEELDTFDASEVLGDATDDLPAKVDNMVIMQRVGAIQAAVKDYLDDIDLTDDDLDEEFLDLLLMDEKEMFATIAKTSGVPENPEDCTEDHRELIERMAKGAIETIRKHSPNKMADDLSSIDVNGATYQFEKLLGQGANGSARCYKNPVNGETIIVKSLNPATAEDNRPNMVKEMRMHARLQKGDTTESKDTIAELKGAAVADDGTLHMIMADAGGADLGKVTDAMLLMDDIGAIPPEARTAMVKDFIRQTIDGLKYLEEKNAIHNDLKPENIMIDEDGKVKIIDFGESNFGDEEGMEPSAKEAGYGTTPIYEAPEQFAKPKKKVDKGVDTYAIGGILKAMGGGYAQNALGELSSYKNKFKGEEEIVSALDRTASSAMAEDSAERPSLDAIAASSFLSLDEDHRDYVPEDVIELKKAAAAFQKTLAGVKSTFAHKEIDGVPPGDKDMISIQSTIAEAEATLVNTRALIEREEKAGRTPPAFEYGRIDELETKIAALKSKRNEAVAAARETGEAEYQELLKDPSRRVDYGAGDVSIKDALAARDAALSENSKLRGAYYRDEATYRKDRDNVLERLDEAKEEERSDIEAELKELETTFGDRIAEVNRQLKENIEKANAITAAIESNLEGDLTDAARFHLADLRLREVGSRFGRATDATGSTSRAEAPEEVEEDDEKIERVD